MKLTTRKPTPPALWHWMRGHLPAGLVAYVRTDGYGGTYGITVKEAGMPSFLNRWFGESIATVEGRTVYLQHPEWTSDFTDMLHRYELHYGQETELVVYEESSPRTTYEPS